MLTITECPRDAMQGIKTFIPTQVKVNYLNQLLKVGFDYLDFGSFVSPKAIPQMSDTAEVLAKLDLSQTSTKLLAIIGNLRGAESAVQYESVSLLGYPLSVSETFQQRNVNKSIKESLTDLAQIQELCVKHGKSLQVYLSMGFGNPYGDPYSPEIVAEMAQALVEELGVKHIAPSDTIGSSEPDGITSLFKVLTATYPDVRFSAHLHARPDQTFEKIAAAWAGGCRHFDAALLGFGGCPMAKDDLTGNMPTEHLKLWLDNNQHSHKLDQSAWDHALLMAGELFGQYNH